MELLEAYHDPEFNKIVPWRDFESAAKAMPSLRAQVQTFRAYGGMAVKEILGPKWSSTAQRQAVLLDSVVLLNRGTGFELVRLPVEAQFAPAFGLVVCDYDGNGTEDLFLAQNFFGVEPETSRYDAGRGLWLNGDGRGGFQPVPGHVSGIKIYGEQRGCAVGDFDRDGRPDLIVAQNAGTTQLYRNARGTPGLRVSLRGPDSNPAAAGAVIRVQFGERLGPAREIHGGGGYWSQDASTQVLGLSGVPTGVWVRWPNGITTTHSITSQAREIQLEFSSAAPRHP
jgi:hypothetical protein